MGQFNIRVYGLLINENEQVLVSDERIRGQYITKFPGGGLEYGEGLIDCLKREFMEETKTPVEVIEHFYTTDFYQPSAFHKDHQIISVYYVVKPLSALAVPVRTKQFDFEAGTLDAESFRWMELQYISADKFTLPIDKLVAELLQKKFSV
jgi:ADP-ribose pyrophosphatase YjhB (NUDIX family)